MTYISSQPSAKYRNVFGKVLIRSEESLFLNILSVLIYNACQASNNDSSKCSPCQLVGRESQLQHLHEYREQAGQSQWARPSFQHRGKETDGSLPYRWANCQNPTKQDKGKLKIFIYLFFLNKIWKYFIIGASDLMSRTCLCKC